jgi:hypothetical protein
MFRYTFRLLFLALGAALLIPAAHAQWNDYAGCSNLTVKGHYAFRISGEVFVSSAPPAVVKFYRDGVAIAYFNGATDNQGNGDLSQQDYIVGNGAFAPNPGNNNTYTNGFNTNETGKYHVFGDCTGWAEISFPHPVTNTSAAPIPYSLQIKFVIAKQGQILHTIVSDLEVLLPGSSTPSPLPANIHSDAERMELF